jgi:hypothetical protein
MQQSTPMFQEALRLLAEKARAALRERGISTESLSDAQAIEAERRERRITNPSSARPRMPIMRSQLPGFRSYWVASAAVWPVLRGHSSCPPGLDALFLNSLREAASPGYMQRQEKRRGQRNLLN